jgi:hypothetical protein
LPLADHNRAFLEELHESLNPLPLMGVILKDTAFFPASVHVSKNTITLEIQEPDNSPIKLTIHGNFTHALQHLFSILLAREIRLFHRNDNRIKNWSEKTAS